TACRIGEISRDRMNKYRLKAFQTVFCPDLRRKGAVAGKSFHCSLFFSNSALYVGNRQIGVVFDSFK
ncbi:hypothetical protein MM809_37910, partial [Klebsiella pneumoniae]|nr:hypothetical protein [Klebsiella pneumoniae]